jgi:hypothetical protein
MAASWEASTEAALEALEAVSTRDLLRTARMLERKNHDALGLSRFAGTFRAVVYDRQERLEEPSRYTRIQVESAVLMASYGALAERLADAPEPFWQHVREAILAYREEAAA